MVGEAVSTVVAAVDVGTNSTRLLIRNGSRVIVRRTTVTGLGRGVSRTGLIGMKGRTDTLRALTEYRKIMTQTGAVRSRAVMTAVGRDAADAGTFAADAAVVLETPLEIITGDEEASLAYAGATSDLIGGDWTVVDIGGGSTEIVTAARGASLGMGSVRLTDLYLQTRPVEAGRLSAARDRAAGVLGSQGPAPGGVVGVAGTWTSLAAMTRAAGGEEPAVHHARLDREAIEDWIARLAVMPLEETARLGGLDPKRAPVILGGAIVAVASLDALGADVCLVSERDLLDGVAAGLVDTR